MTQAEPLDQHLSPVTASGPAPARSWHWRRGIGAAALSVVIVGVPTDVLDTGWFTRMTPVRWWEYPALVLTAVLTGLWFAIVRAGSGERGGVGVFGSSVLSAFAVGCPLCNKIVLGLLGVSGALGVWAPIQPLLALASVGLLGAAVIIRWRRRACAPDACLPTPRG